MRVLIFGEYSGRVRKAFRALGHDAWSCDLIAAEDGSPYHLQCDGMTILNDGWDMMIAHPDCTYLTNAAAWCYNDVQTKKLSPDKLYGAARRQAREEAIIFVQKLMDAPIEKMAIENPAGVISTRIRPPDQIIQPNEYGEDASKTTCLWLKNLSLSYVRQNILILGGCVVVPYYLTHWVSTVAQTVSVKRNRYHVGPTKRTPGKINSHRLLTDGRIEHAPIKVGQMRLQYSGVVL